MTPNWSLTRRRQRGQSALLLGPAVPTAVPTAALLHQVTSSQSSGEPVGTTDVEYAEAVHAEIRRLWKYFGKQMTRYRVARTIVIVSAALVPVLATAPQVPRWVLGVFGAVAVVTEGIQGLYQFRTSALNAMRTGNALERVLNKYMTAVTPYEGAAEKAFPVFVKDIEAIRETADEAFLQTWQAGEVTPVRRRGASAE